MSVSCWLQPPVANMPAAFLCPFEDNTTLFRKATVRPRNIQLGETAKPDCPFFRLPIFLELDGEALFILREV